jgi:hypothetical protein
LRNIHIFNAAALVSRGLPVGDVPSMKRDIPVMIRRISEDLFINDPSARAARTSAEVPAEFDVSHYEGCVYDKARIS